MTNCVKLLIATTAPAFLVTSALFAKSPPAPSTQPATQPSTQPAPENITHSNQPLVIPDGTSREHPGPDTPGWQGGTIQFTGGIRQ